MSKANVIDYGKTSVKAKKFIGEVAGSVAPEDIQIAAGTSGLSAANLQVALQAIWTELATKADA